MPNAGDDFKDVRQGDPFRLPANTHNYTMKVLRWFKSQQLGNDAPRGEGFPDPGMVLIKNTSGSNLPRFSVLGIAGPMVDAATDLATFKNRVILTGGTPASGDAGRFVVCLQPLAIAAVGLAVVSGAVPVQVDVQTAGDNYADVSNGNTDRLRSGNDGGARILWSAGGTGLQWAIVNVGCYRLPTPRALYQVLLVINSSQDVAFDGPRFA